MRGAAIGKARLPTVESLTEGTNRRLVSAERSVRRPSRSATGTSGPRTVARSSPVQYFIRQHGKLIFNPPYQRYTVTAVTSLRFPGTVLVTSADRLLWSTVCGISCRLGRGNEGGRRVDGH